MFVRVRSLFCENHNSPKRMETGCLWMNCLGDEMSSKSIGVQLSGGPVDVVPIVPFSRMRDSNPRHLVIFSSLGTYATQSNLAIVIVKYSCNLYTLVIS